MARNLRCLLSIFIFIPFSYAFCSEIPLLKIKTFKRKRIQKRKEIFGEMTIQGGETFPIKIRRRGKSSDGFRKKQYQFKMIDASKKTLKKSLLDFQKGKKWILNGPFVDKTLMRNPLAYGVARNLKNSKGEPWYVPQTKYVELKINNRYQGIYILIDKMARGKKRVGLKKFSPENLEFIAEIHGERFGPKADFHTSNGTPMQFFYPSRKDLAKLPEGGLSLKNRIEKAIDQLEWQILVTRPFQKLRKIIDVTSFANYLLIQEIFKNLDGYRRSVYFHLKKGKFHMGPVWDFNISMGNIIFYKEITSTSGFMYTKRSYFDGNHNISWFKKLMHYKDFRKKVVEIYKKERKLGGAFHWKTIDRQISGFQEEMGRKAISKNFQKWKVIGRLFSPFWHNTKPRPKTYKGEVLKMKKWLTNRFIWLDKNLVESF